MAEYNFDRALVHGAALNEENFKVIYENMDYLNSKFNDLSLNISTFKLPITGFKDKILLSDGNNSAKWSEKTLTEIIDEINNNIQDSIDKTNGDINKFITKTNTDISDIKSDIDNIEAAILNINNTIGNMNSLRDNIKTSTLVGTINKFYDSYTTSIQKVLKDTDSNWMNSTANGENLFAYRIEHNLNSESIEAIMYYKQGETKQRIYLSYSLEDQNKIIIYSPVKCDLHVIIKRV